MDRPESSRYTFAEVPGPNAWRPGGASSTVGVRQVEQAAAAGRGIIAFPSTQEFLQCEIASTASPRCSFPWRSAPSLATAVRRPKKRGAAPAKPSPMAAMTGIPFDKITQAAAVFEVLKDISSLQKTLWEKAGPGGRRRAFRQYGAHAVGERYALAIGQFSPAAFGQQAEAVFRESNAAAKRQQDLAVFRYQAGNPTSKSTTAATTTATITVRRRPRRRGSARQPESRRPGTTRP